MLGNNQMLTDEEDRAIGCAAWVVIALSLAFLLFLLAASGCVSTPDMSRRESMDIMGVMNALGK